MFSTLGNFVWAPEWGGIGEGPYTLAAKFLTANNLTTSYLRKGIVWRQGTSASLLDPSPTSNEDKAAVIGRMLHQASLAARIPGLYKNLATDQELRYCTKCISRGFQAAIAQIPGIERCPIHGEIHRNTCIHCGAKTQPYFLYGNHRLSFSCNKCGRALGGDLLIDRRVDAWSAPEHLDRLDPIHIWLERANSSKNINWVNLSNWSTATEFKEGMSDHTKHAVFDLLRSRLLPDKAVPESNLVQKPQVFGPFPLARSGKLSRRLNEDEYELVLRRLAPPEDFELYREHFRTPSFCVAVPVTPMAPLHLHAHLIWRAQFGEFGPRSWKPHSRMDFCSEVIPMLLNVHGFNPSISNHLIVDGILSAAWAVSMKIAVEWHQMQIRISELPLGEAKWQWLTAIDQWANRLGCWRHRNFFPIGIIKVTDQVKKKEQLSFVVA